MKPLRLLFIGFGHVGQKVTEILFAPKENYRHLSDRKFLLTGICTRFHGMVLNPAGIDVKRALADMQESGVLPSTDPEYAGRDVRSILRSDLYDIVVEMSSLSIASRGEPALQYLRDALQTSHHAVSANKGPIAFAYHDLKRLAESNDRHLLFESTVMDGAPIFNLARSALKGCTITGVSGILNSTTNVILTEIEKGSTYAEAVIKAQNLGIAEADPSHDIEGWDAAAKISILSNVLLGGSLTPCDVTRKGIENHSEEEIRSRHDFGQCLKLIARACRQDGAVKASVKPEYLPLTDPFAAVSGTGSIIRIETDLMCPLAIRQEQPTVSDTAYGVINDLLEIYTLESSRRSQD
ncbi:MAG: homoserine dehydrogenase [bacterium]